METDFYNGYGTLWKWYLLFKNFEVSIVRRNTVIHVYTAVAEMSY